jgi:hypothetical protein
VSGILLFGWLLWAPGASKKSVLSRNVLVVSWSNHANSRKITEKLFSKTSQKSEEKNLLVFCKIGP